MAPSLENANNGSCPENSQTAIVMVPLPAQGHLNQLLHLSRLLSAANLPVYYVGIATHVRQARQRVHGWDPAATANIHFQEFETAPFQSPPPNPDSSAKFPNQLMPAMMAAMNLREPVSTFVSRLSGNFRWVVMIFDALMSPVVQDVATVPNVEFYRFQSISGFTVYALHWEDRGMPEPPAGAEVLKEVPGSDGCFTPEFLEFCRLQKGSREIFSGDIYNSNRAIEGFFLDLLEKERTTGADRVWAIGPFNPVVIPEKHNSKTGHKCLEWLDRQDPDSVIFVSFGTTSSLSDEQITELALGLERSRQKFIWVVRDADKGDIFTGDVRKAKLPEGYEEERVKDRGMVIRDWAPQLEILGHASTGGFMSHCGWNSCMESISMGVPMATWPMHSDQPSNAALVTKVLRIGVEVKNWAHRDEVVASDTVENVVRILMASDEGNEMRRRAQELGMAVRDSVKEGGNSCREMKSFITHIIR